MSDLNKNPDTFSDPEIYLTEMKARVTRYFCILCFILAILAIPASFFSKDPSTLIINSVGLLFYALPVIIIRKIERYTLAAKFFVLTTMITTSANGVATNFSIAMPTTVWYFAYIVFAYLVLNFRWMMLIIGFCFTSVTAFTILHLYGLNQINPRYDEQSMLIGSPFALAVALAALVYLLTVYRRLRDVMFQKVLTANREKNQMVGVMSHDLRNYFGAIQGMCSIIKSDLDEQASSPQLENLDHNISIIDQASVAALNLVDEVVAAARDTAAQNLFLEVHELKQFITPIFHRYQVLSQAKGVRFIMPPSEQGVYAAINKDAFSRVIENLLSNALKFSKADDSVTITIGTIGTKATVSIADTGIGIPDHLQKILFTPFTKAGRTGTANERSIGLGLSIVKKLVDLHNGMIECRSEAGNGTTFTITLAQVHHREASDNPDPNKQ